MYLFFGCCKFAPSDDDTWLIIAKTRLLTIPDESEFEEIKVSDVVIGDPLPVPEPTMAVEGAEELEVVGGNEDETEGETEGETLSLELLELKDRAKKLSEDLERLNSAMTAVGSGDGDGGDDDDGDEELEEMLIKRISSSSEIDFDDDQKEEEKICNSDLCEIPELSKDDVKAKTKLPPVRQTPLFPDLSLEGEKLARMRSGPSNRGYYWHMPFRHEVSRKRPICMIWQCTVSDAIFTPFSSRQFYLKNAASTATGNRRRERYRRRAQKNAIVKLFAKAASNIPYTGKPGGNFL